MQMAYDGLSAAAPPDVVALVTTLCMNRLQTGEFVQK